MSVIRHFSVSFSTPTPFFAIGGVTSDCRHEINKGQRSNRPLCCIFDHISFQSVNQNCITRRKSDGHKCRMNGTTVGIFIQQVSANRHHPTLEESAFRRGPTLEPSDDRWGEVSKSCLGRRRCLPECQKHVGKATHVDEFLKKIQKDSKHHPHACH